ncbi:MAG TPA: 30S ribosome-binding factor RbfA [Candidatus Parcubacteria bacterium]|nr:30S ribosome-binding factor RbfA [Candidatus Parcubacteria bacterium]
MSRIPRVNSLIKRELGKIILKEVELPEGVLATITRVETSSDLNQAKIYVSVIPSGRADETLRVLEKDIYTLQKMLDRQLRMKFVPKIIFKRETETEKAERVEEIIEQIHSKKS